MLDLVEQIEALAHNFALRSRNDAPHQRAGTDLSLPAIRELKGATHHDGVKLD